MNPADLFSALADPTRLRVVELLHEASRPVHELSAAFSISRPAISRHLRVLKQAGLVKEIKQGRENVYSLQADRLKPAIAWLEAHRARRPAKVVASKRRVAKAGKPAPRPAPAGVPKARKPIVARPPTPQLSFFDL